MHVFFKDSMSPIDQMHKQLASLEKKRLSAEFRSQLLEHELRDYQQQVATLVPAAIEGKNSRDAYPLRQLASIAGGGDLIQIERASGLFEEAKKAFREKNLEEASDLFGRLINRFPVSAHVIEAHFLMAETYYQQKEYADAVATIEKMIDLFPENELTGYALLRLGKIYEIQDRPEDAGDIYRAVQANFRQADLVRQAQASLQAVQL